MYVGSSNIQKDLDYYTEILGAKKVWDIPASAQGSPPSAWGRVRCSYSQTTVRPKAAF